MDRTQRDGLLFAGLAIIGYAMLPIFAKLVYQYSDVDPLGLAMWRFSLAAPAMWLLVLLRRRFAQADSGTRESLPRLKLFLMGFILASASMMMLAGLNLIDASVYTVLFRIFPVLVAVILVFLGQPLPGRGWVALAMVIVGVAFTQPGVFSMQLAPNVLGGMLLAFGQALLIAVYTILQSVLMKGRKAMARASAWTITGAFSLMLPLILFRGLPPLDSWQATAALIALVGWSTVMAVFALYSAVTLLGPARMSIIGSLEPVVTLIVAVLLLGESMLLLQVLGGALILASALVLEVRLPRHRRNRPAVTMGAD